MKVSTFHEFMRAIIERGLEYFGLYYSRYRGEVVSNEDPKQYGRLRIKCASVYGNQVPPYWAWPVGIAAVGVQSGLFDIPEPGDPVYIEFEMGRSRYPLWSPGWWGKRGGQHETPWPGRVTPPEVAVWRMKDGSRIEFDRRSGRQRVLVIGADGSYINLDCENRTIEVTSQGDCNEQFAEDHSRMVGDNEEISIGGNRQIQVAGGEVRDVAADLVESVGKNWKVVVSGGITFQSLGELNLIGGAGVRITSLGKLILESLAGMDIQAVGPMNIFSMSSVYEVAPDLYGHESTPAFTVDPAILVNSTEVLASAQPLSEALKGGFVSGLTRVASAYGPGMASFLDPMSAQISLLPDEMTVNDLGLLRKISQQLDMGSVGFLDQAFSLGIEGVASQFPASSGVSLGGSLGGVVETITDLSQGCSKGDVSQFLSNIVNDAPLISQITSFIDPSEALTCYFQEVNRNLDIIQPLCGNVVLKDVISQFCEVLSGGSVRGVRDGLFGKIDILARRVEVNDALNWSEVADVMLGIVGDCDFLQGFISQYMSIMDQSRNMGLSLTLTPVENVKDQVLQNARNEIIDALLGGAGISTFDGFGEIYREALENAADRQLTQITSRNTCERV